MKKTHACRLKIRGETLLAESGSNQPSTISAVDTGDVKHIVEHHLNKGMSCALSLVVTVDVAGEGALVFSLLLVGVGITRGVGTGAL